MSEREYAHDNLCAFHSILESYFYSTFASFGINEEYSYDTLHLPVFSATLMPKLSALLMSLKPRSFHISHRMTSQIVRSLRFNALQFA